MEVRRALNINVYNSIILCTFLRSPFLRVPHTTRTRAEHTCKDFRCTTKEFCISPDLLCDNVNHCEDGSDEAIGTLCEGNFYSLNCHLHHYHHCSGMGVNL